MSGFLTAPSAAFPATNSQQRQDSGRNKVGLKPGRSLMDWIKLGKSGADIQGFRGKIQPVTLDELSKHNTVHDCWMAIRGHVYNVTHYMEYHPGGVEELMKGAGKDATALFESVHKWVNFSSMLAKCYVGPLKFEHKLSELLNKKPSKPKNEGTMLAPTIIPAIIKEYLPRFEWYEKEKLLVLTIYIKNFHPTDVIADCVDGETLDIKIIIDDKFYRIHLKMEHFIKELNVSKLTDKKVEITLEKEAVDKTWVKYGTPLYGHHSMKPIKDRELRYYQSHIVSIQKVTHDTKLYGIKLPNNCYFESPIGYHTIIRSDISGIEVQRSYTVALHTLDQTLEERSVDSGRILYFMIKHYDDGALTPFIKNLQLKSTIEMSDCLGTFKSSVLKGKTKLHMIAAGTGLTPMIRLINSCLHDVDTTLEMKLLFANKEQRDILWKDQIDNVVEKYPNQFHCTYILSRPDSSWTGLSGRIKKDILQSFIDYKPFVFRKDDNDLSVSVQIAVNMGELFTICGPDEFTVSIKNMLIDLGVDESNIHCFLG